MSQTTQVDVLVIGAGAAGLMCAIQAGYRGRSVTVVDMGKKPGRKILISGGGRCNFTNQGASPENYICQNPHFVKSALSRYTQYDFIDMVERHCVPYHHKTLGQLFCDESAQDIVDMLMTECDWAGVNVQLRTEVNAVSKNDAGFYVSTNTGDFECESLVVASGGLTMPKLGATPIGYQIASQFGLKVLPTRAALVPFTLHEHDKQRFEALSGISVPVIAVSDDSTEFKENLLFTHRGVSGPAILQISSYWQPGEPVTINLLPEHNVEELLHSEKQQHPDKSVKNVLSQYLPNRFIDVLVAQGVITTNPIKQLQHAELSQLATSLTHWTLKPNGTEGYRTAEVTLGGVDTDDLSSKTMEAKNVKGLYFLGEVMDVTGWLGGYNFQWCWSSGWAAGQVV